jgi:CDP-6-deoxy-D-xylo-4-hexulose-3-dehydrase
MINNYDKSIKIWNWQESRQKNGIKVLLEETSTKKFLGTPGKIKRHIQKFVKFVEKNIKHIFLRDQKIVLEDVKIKVAPVYNLMIENCHEFFANGILVHNCDCLGGKIYGEPVGTFSDVSTYSFFPAHHITTIEGGAVCTNNPAIAKKIHSLNNWGRDCFCRPGQQNVCGKRFEQEFDGLPAGWDHKYTFTNLGYNFKMTEFQAAFGIAQMRKLNGFVDRRIENLWSLLERLDDYVAWLDFVELPEYSSSSPFGFPITVTTNEFTAQNLIAFLEKNKIATRRMFGGNLARQPAFKNLPYIYCGFDGADYVMNRTFWIGCHPGITNEMLDYIEEIFGEFFKQYE